MSDQVIEFTVTQEEMFDHGPKIPAIYLLVAKGLKTVGSFSHVPIGVIEWWDNPANGDRHFKQVIKI